MRPTHVEHDREPNRDGQEDAARLGAAEDVGCRKGIDGLLAEVQKGEGSEAGRTDLRRRRQHVGSVEPASGAATGESRQTHSHQVARQRIGRRVGLGHVAAHPDGHP